MRMFAPVYRSFAHRNPRSHVRFSLSEIFVNSYFVHIDFGGVRQVIRGGHVGRIGQGVDGAFAGALFLLHPPILKPGKNHSVIKNISKILARRRQFSFRM